MVIVYRYVQVSFVNDACIVHLQHRNKEGILELKKNEGLKKMWKSFSFKVSASTYLLYFKTSDVSPAVLVNVNCSIQ